MSHRRMKGLIMSYIRIWVHLVWATKNHNPLLEDKLKIKIINHIRENAKNNGIHLDLIDGSTDHIHSLISLKANQSISQVVNLLREESMLWLSKRHLAKLEFHWQEDYTAISVGQSAINQVRDYIKKQEEHHRKKVS